jgi:hypothetical protein
MFVFCKTSRLALGTCKEKCDTDEGGGWEKTEEAEL